jgi:glycerate 2-kinase
MATPTQSANVSKPVYSNGKQLAHHIFLETMAALDVRRAMLAKLHRAGNALVAGDVSFPLARPPRVVAVGKAANRMAAVLHEILAGEIAAGVCVSPAEPSKKLANFQNFQGGHPYPNAGSLEGARAALELVRDSAPDDAVIFLVSGGGSALFELPMDPEVTLADLAALNRVLVTSALRIEEINVLRKHLSRVKGGRLAVAAHPARQLTVYISDVPERFPSMVASGPTLPDESTVGEAYDIAERFKLAAKLPPRIRKQFEERELEETPKPGDARFRSSQYFCLLSNRDAVETARSAAEKLGFACQVAGGPDDAEFRGVADAHAAALGALARQHPGSAVCLIAGGEVTSPVIGGGTGGRNQAYTLYAAQKIESRNRIVLSAGTDGRDGNSPACGAVADGHTISRAHALGMDAAQYLAESDSYHFFRSLGDTLETGFTDNNVRDLRLWMEFPKAEGEELKGKS